MSKATKKVEEELKMDMTPMIDCVFLLMIFFVLVIDLSQKELEDLILPKAEFSEPDDKPPEFRPIVNIMQDGRMVYKRKDYYKPEQGEKFDTITELLFQWKRDLRDHYLRKGLTAKEIADEHIVQEKVGGGMTMTVVNDPVLIRADKWTEWYFVGKFMEKCTHPKAAFWKLELALSEEDKELKRMGLLKK